MNIRTHRKIDQNLCGKPISLKEEKCVVELTPSEEMRIDDSGLIHGGFIFSAADYAAMLAVNHPNVVLGEASFRFKKPLLCGEKMFAEAKIVGKEKKKKIVNVKVRKNSKKTGEIIGEG
ncbi:MAG: PaaI family thioesterase, partial [Promethearchaeia archaeon]